MAQQDRRKWDSIRLECNTGIVPILFTNVIYIIYYLLWPCLSICTARNNISTTVWNTESVITNMLFKKEDCFSIACDTNSRRSRCKIGILIFHSLCNFTVVSAALLSRRQQRVDAIWESKSPNRLATLWDRVIKHFEDIYIRIPLTNSDEIGDNIKPAC